VRPDTHSDNLDLSRNVLIDSEGTYAASKRAAEIMFDTLRLELKPFGINVTSVITGPVKSHIHSHLAGLKLPEKSLYADVEETIVKRAAGDDGSPRMDTTKYAETVVNKILGGGHITIWCGANMWLINIISNWIPNSIRVSNTPTCLDK
jgi:short-subunit dehydrogenase